MTEVKDKLVTAESLKNAYDTLNNKSYEKLDVVYNKTNNSLVFQNTPKLPDNVYVDKTLTESGNAADAKVTGDAITELKNETNGLKSDLASIENALNFTSTINITQSDLEQGAFSVNGLAETFLRIRTKRAIKCYKDTVLNFNVGDLYSAVQELNSSVRSGENIIVNNSWAKIQSYTVQNDCWIMIEFANGANESASTNIYPADFGTYSVSSVGESLDFEELSENVDKLNGAISDIAFQPFLPFETTISSGKMLLVTGSIIDYSGYSVTDYMDVSGQSQVKITGASNYQNGIACFYDSSKTFISCALQANSGGTNTVYIDELVDVPSGAKYLVVSGRGSTIASAKGQFAYTLLSKWHDKTWLAFGDSLTDSRNTRATERYFDYIRETTDITVINGGVSGSGYCVDGESAFGENTNWMDRILTYQNTDFDVVTLFGSFNDMSSGLPTGTATDTGTSTKAGCINTTLDNLFSIKPLAIVGVITPTPWETAYPTEQYAEAYVDVLIQICRNRGIPCLDLFHESLLRPWDATFRTLAYSRDGGKGVHPDENGHKMIAPRIEAFLDKLLLH